MSNLHKLMTINNGNNLVSIDEVIENQHLINIINDDENVVIMPIEPQEANIYIGDFHGLLAMKSIDSMFFNIFTMLNDLESSNDYAGDFTNIKVLNQETINILLNFN